MSILLEETCAKKSDCSPDKRDQMLFSAKQPYQTAVCKQMERKLENKNT